MNNYDIIMKFLGVKTVMSVLSDTGCSGVVSFNAACR